jgi:hypothetical protein
MTITLDYIKIKSSDTKITKIKLVHLNRNCKVESLCRLPGKRKKKEEKERINTGVFLEMILLHVECFLRSMNNDQECLLANRVV